jgi:nucleoside-diphosphate-sugar epimerase
VTGSAGYVGSALIPSLLERGYCVDVVDLFWFGNNLPAQTGVLSKDLFDVTVEDLKDYDQVIFLAGLSNDPMAEFSPSKNFIYNAAAPAYLAYTVKKAGVKRYVYSSDWDNPAYYNMQAFRALETGISNHALGKPVGAGR